MIYLFDKHKKLKGTVRARHTIALLYERERNGIYSVSAEIPVSLTDKRTVYNYHKKVKGSDFIGHYDREGRFQLHKIAAVDIENTSIFIKGIHLFFDEAKAGAIIRERRFRGREIIDGAREAFDTIGWSVVDFDNSDQKNYSFYNVSPLEARAILVETFGFEFDYWLDFDGKNLRNKQMAVKKKIGKETNKRYNYGHNVLSIKVEQDYSEIYTAVIGRGKGEDLDDSDGYGRRIEFTDVEWKKPSKPLDKAKGSRTLIDPNATQLFGYHDGTTVSPRTKVEIFSDIEDEAQLLQASYDWLMDNNVPKAVFSLNVPDGDGLDLGDSVHVIYRDIDLIKSTRVTKVIDDLVSGNRSVEFGDTAYFDTDRRISGLKADLKRVGGSTSSRIARLKAEFDKRFDEEVQQWKDDFEQALIDAEADVEAMRAEMTEEFEAAQKEFEEEFNQSVADAKKHADDVADAKAKQVQDNLDTFKGEHEFLVGELQGNIIDIDGELADAKADVSSILGRLTVVDGSISGINGSISGIKGSLTEVKDSLTEVEGTLTNTKTQLENQISDARADLEESISNTRAELEDKIDTTEEALNKVGEDLGNAKTDLQRQLDEARAELDGLEVGTRNLIPDSHFYGGSNNAWSHVYGTQIVEEHILKKTYTSASYSARIERTFRGLEVGQTYTLTMSLKTDVDINWSGFVAAELIKSSDTSASEEYKIYSVTFKVTSEELVYIRGYQRSVKIGSYAHMDWFTLVKGNVPTTDWTPAPEDTEQKITNINQTITNIEGELSTKVDQTEVDALKGTVTAQGTLLSQTAEELSSKAEKSVVDTLTGRVTNTESSVTQNASEIAKRLTKSVYDEDKKATDAKITQWSNTATETAEGLTRVIGRVSETEAGIDTAQTRIEAEAGRIDGLLSRTSNVEGKVRDAELAIEANADGLALRATKTEVEQAIDDIEVGGRNLIAHSLSSPRYLQVDGTTISFEEEEWSHTDYIPIEENEQFIISGYTNLGNNPATVFYDSDKEYISGLSRRANNPKFTAPVNAKYMRFSYRNNEVGSIKLERGTVATDWTPAPEDIDSSISEVTGRVTTAEAELVVHAGEISQKASQSELNRVTGRVSTAETSIIQNADEIARRLVKSDYDTDKAKIDGDITKWSNLTSETAEGLEQTISRVSTAEGKLSDAELSIKANADSLKLTATKTEVENAIDGIEVGGRNYFSLSSAQKTGGIVTIPVEPNTDYIVSSNVPVPSNGTTLYFDGLSSNTDGVWVGNSIVRNSGDKETMYVRIYPNREYTSELMSGDYYIMWEKGNKVTDWSPAPEDTEAKITKAQADIQINADEIATKVSNSEFNSLSGKVSDNSSAITQTANEVKSKVTQAEVDYSMTHIDNGSIKTVKDVASFYDGKASVKGALLIKTNITGRAMSRVFIKGYNYSTNSSNIDVVISFYNFTTSILNHGYTSTGSKEIDRVRLFRDSDGIVYILLNDFDSTWSYPAIVVDRFDMSYSYSWTWGEDWKMSVVDSMPEDVAYITEVKGQDFGSIVSKHETDIVQNADEIALKASQSDLNSVTGRVSSAESQLSVQAGQIALRATKKELDGVDGRVSATEASLTVLDDEISSVVGRVSDNETVISSVVQDVGSITSTVATLEGDVASQGSQIEQTNDVISSKVWMDDIANIGANLIPFSDTQNQAIMVENWDFLSDGGSTFYTGVTPSGFFTLRNSRSGTTLRMRSRLFDRLVAGKEYTLSFLIQRTAGVNSAYNYTWIIRPSGVGNFNLGNPTRITDNGDGTYTHEYVFTSDYTGKVGVAIGSYTSSGQDLWLRVKEPKLERGSKRTPYMTAFSVVEQRAEELSLRVQELSSINGEEILSQSDISVLPDRVLIGSQNIGAIDMASILTVSPTAINMITNELNLTGNLNVKGQIESISTSAVKANFGDVVAGTADIRFIQAKHLASDSVQTRHLYVDNAMAEKLIANTVMASEIRALSLTAVEANIGSIRSKILTSDVILSSHINSSTALIDKIFSSNAMFERMMAKNGFVRTLNTVTIDTDQLTIRRPDGVAWVSQGLARGHVPVQIFDNYADSSVQFTGLNFVTSSSFWKNFKYFYTPHEGSRLRVVWAVSLQTGNSASEYIEVGVDGFGNYNPINNGTGSSTRRQLVYAGQTEYITQDIPLPPPNFQTFQANLQFRRSPTGVHLDNRVTVRILHIGQYN